MRSLPLIIVVGANDLALRVCEELCATSGHEVVVLWHGDAAAAERVRRRGAAFAAMAPNEYESLEAVGVKEAACIMPVSEDDRLNLQVALKARDLNPEIRVVLRQFNRALGRKIEQHISNCSAISPAAHAAATYAAAALDPSCVYAVQFPALDGPLLGFSERRAGEFGVEDCSVAEAERKVRLRILALNGAYELTGEERIASADTVVACGEIRALADSWPQRAQKRSKRKGRVRGRLRALARRVLRADPLLSYTFAAGLLFYIAATLYFMNVMKLTFLQSLYFVAATMFTVGYGDITPFVRHAHWPAYAVAILAMGAGVSIGGIFIATMSSALSRAQERALRGLRHIRAENHIVVCGAGNVGSGVIQLLLDADRRVVVIEPRPSALILELAHTRKIDLLASDATDERTLAYCDLPSACSLVAVTDSDTSNLESALGALVYESTLPVVMRIQDADFSKSVERNFKIAKSFSASDLTAPAIAGLARFPASRGRVTFGQETFNIAERSGGSYIPRREHGVPLFVWRSEELLPVNDFDEVRQEDRLLDIVPLSQFKTVPEPHFEAADA